MFTGIIEATGRVARVEPRGGDVRLLIDAGAFDLRDVAIGDSISVSGACLTAVAIENGMLAFDVSTETLSRTSIGALGIGARVNLEKALRLSDRLGGHLVSGHVDGIGSVVAIQADARSQRWTFELPAELARYAAPKGSIAIDGVSLTINEVDGNRFGVSLIPHTIGVTTLGDRKVGDPVNIEVDMIARYVERLTFAGG
ncbi:MAG TPA: riboflavin synthase [Rhodanobacteraceae bacterium]|nr:riboflavin synthase [Rhodanobacteraceae bacterium]